MKLKKIIKEESIIEELCKTEIINAVDEIINNAPDTRAIVVPYTKNEKLYHYCSLETFYNIIESNCFWLSHPKYMNDLSEHKYAIGTTKKILQEYTKTIDENDVSKVLFDLIESNFKEYEDAFKGADEDKYEKLSFFTCFSSDGDNLPMWSMYKGKNIGLAIGLDFSDENYFVDFPVTSGKNIKIKKKSPFNLNLSSHCFFSDIEYQEDRIKKATNTFLNHIRNFYNRRQTQLNNHIKHANQYLAEETVSILINMSLDLKNSNFSYEKETRLILSEYQEEDIKFRVRDKFIVPYIEFPLEEKTVEDENKDKIKIKQKFNKPIIPIKSITISPNAEEPELVKASIWAFLNHKGYKIKREDIKQSTIPFKPR